MDKAHEYYKKGNALRAEGNDDAAIKEFEKAVTLDPHFWLAKKSLSFLKKFKEKKHSSFGNLYHSEGRLKEAIEEFKEAHKANPNSWRTAHKLGTLYQETRQYDNAVKLFKHALACSPQIVTCHAALAHAYEAHGSFHDAVEQYRIALTMSPHDSILVKQKKLAEKISKNMLRIKNQESQPTLYVETASLLLEKGLTHQAITLLQNATKSMKENGEIIFSLGTIYYQLNRFKLAGRYFKKALENKSSQLHREEIHYNLGLALAAQEKWKDAVREWKACIQLAPRSRAALRAKANLELFQKKNHPTLFDL